MVCYAGQDLKSTFNPYLKVKTSQNIHNHITITTVLMCFTLHCNHLLELPAQILRSSSLPSEQLCPLALCFFDLVVPADDYAPIQVAVASQVPVLQPVVLT